MMSMPARVERDRSARQEFEAGVVVNFESGLNRLGHHRCQLVDHFFFLLAVLDRLHCHAPPRGICKASLAAAPSDCGVDPGFTIPQCPCDMYSQRQTSPIRIRSGTSRFMARAACCTMPSSAQAPVATSSFLSGRPNRITDGHAQGMNFLRLFHRLIHREIEHARHGANFLAHTFAGTNEHGIDKRVGSEAGFAHQVAKLGGAAETAKTGDRKGHENHLARIERLSTPDSSRSSLSREQDLVLTCKVAMPVTSGDESNLLDSEAMLGIPGLIHKIERVHNSG